MIAWYFLRLVPRKSKPAEKARARQQDFRFVMINCVSLHQIPGSFPDNHNIHVTSLLNEHSVNFFANPKTPLHQRTKPTLSVYLTVKAVKQQSWNKMHIGTKNKGTPTNGDRQIKQSETKATAGKTTPHSLGALRKFYETSQSLNYEPASHQQNILQTIDTYV